MIGLLVKQVEQPKMDTVEDKFKINLICLHDQLRMIVDMIVDYADQLVIKPFIPEVRTISAQFIPPKQPYIVKPTDVITKVPMSRRRGDDLRAEGGALGRIIMSLFTDYSKVVHTPDIADLVVERGYKSTSTHAMLSKLVAENSLVRLGQGAYRRARPPEDN